MRRLRPSAAVALALAAILLAAAVAAAYGPTRRRVTERLPPSWRIAITALVRGVAVDHSLAVPMADGTVLRASLYVPRGASGKLPTILIRTPYGRSTRPYGFTSAIFFARHGYAVLVQDLRGTGESQGEFVPYEHAADDGVATLDWIAKQPWSDGKVGTFGCSALGETQLILAKRNHPAHRAMIPIAAGGAVGSAAGRYGYFGLFEGGIFELASGFGWYVSSGARHPGAPEARPFDRVSILQRLPVSGLVQSVRPVPSTYEEFLATPPGDPRWEARGYLTDADRTAVPALWIDTWGDSGVGDALALSESWRRADPQRAARQKFVIAAGEHCDHDGVAHAGHFGELAVANADQPYEDWYVAWFDHWLRGKGEALSQLRAYNYFMLGENRWLAADTWPPPEARAERWHLGGHGHANTRAGDGTLSTAGPGAPAFDEFRYDPEKPVPSRGGPQCCTGDARIASGPLDQAEVEWRNDVLVYTSGVLERELRIAGPLKAHLVFGSSAPDTDVVVRLVHVRPNGFATNIQEGALRLRYRTGFTTPTRMEPGKRYEVDVDMRSIAYTVPAGHRLRLHVTSSAFPRLERNLNTGAVNNALETASVLAVNRVFHGSAEDSYVELWALPGGNAAPR